MTEANEKTKQMEDTERMTPPQENEKRAYQVIGIGCDPGGRAGCGPEGVVRSPRVADPG